MTLRTMNIKPRYSLLTLFALTAMIAVGVKFWHGPHHVVERPSPNLEDEYTYTRDWTGSKIVDGPRILRYTFSDSSDFFTIVDYYRKGVNIQQRIVLHGLSSGAHRVLGKTLNNRPRLNLLENEKTEMLAVKEHELSKLHQLGLRVIEHIEFE